MNDKDPKIEYELKSAADEQLPDADKILWKARVEMRRSQPSRNSSAVGRFFAIAGGVAAVLLVFVLGISVLRGLPLFGGNKGDVPNDSQPAAPVSGQTYSASALTARSASYDEAAALYTAATHHADPFPVPRESSDEMTVATSQIYVFRNRETDTDVLIECRLRIIDPTYGNDELTLYFELTTDTYEANKEYLNLPQTDKTLSLKNAREAGEYVSWAYIADARRCMLQVMNPNAYRLLHYLDVLFDITLQKENA